MPKLNYEIDINNLSEKEIKKMVDEYKKSNCVLKYDEIKENDLVVVYKDKKGLIYCQGARVKETATDENFIIVCKKVFNNILGRCFYEKYKGDNGKDKFDKACKLLM